MAFCTECGANVADDLKFCTGCGKEMGASPAPQEQAQPQQQVSTVITSPVQPVQTAQVQTPAYQPQSAFQSGANTAPPKGSRYAVAGVLTYIGMMIVFAIPIVGLIFAIKWSLSKKISLNRRNFAIANLIFAVISLIIGIFFIIMAMTWINSLLDYLRQNAEGQFDSIFDIFKNLPTDIPTN